MSEPDDNATPPVLPSNPMQPSQRLGAGRYVFLFVVVLVAGLFILGGWLVSSFSEFADTMMVAPGNQYTEVTLRAGNSEQRIEVIDVNGIITSYGGLGDNMVSRIKKQLDLAGADSRVKAVLLRIDSPGGEVLASDEIALAITEFQEEHDKPVIASMGGLAASGGYYVAAPCRFIVANELTITGSIGVIMQSINMHGLMEKVGVKPVTFKSGKNKDMLSPFNSPESVSEEQKAILQGFIDETYGKFVRVVEDGRKKTGSRNTKLAKELDSDWRDAADGRILSGKQALDLGMVDKLGNYDVAVAFSEEYVGIDKGKARLVRHEPPFNFGGLFGLLGKVEEEDPGTTLKIDLGLSVPQLKPGLPYYLSPHLYSE
jgi:protease-4|tara:strand:- start:1697 stop:2812 length:1116 start_codon:yes stop_codon:yes gene_type:complete